MSSLEEGRVPDDIPGRPISSAEEPGGNDEELDGMNEELGGMEEELGGMDVGGDLKVAPGGFASAPSSPWRHIAVVIATRHISWT